VTSDAVAREVRQDVSEVLVRYASGIDRRDFALLRSCFTEDCEADYGDIGAWHTADAITAFMEEIHAGFGHTLHRITNHAVTPLDEDRIAARCYVDALIMDPDNQQLVAHAMGFYDDELVRTADGWKIARRRYTMVHLEMG
jgi:3-phenylpropionate/cinnamic acid dioxygenase small subunit